MRLSDRLGAVLAHGARYLSGVVRPPFSLFSRYRARRLERHSPSQYLAPGQESCGTSEALPLFSIAERLCRDGRHEDSVAIYELLAEIRPQQAPYSRREAMARDMRAEADGRSREAARKTHHLPGASEYQKRLRIADIVSDLDDPALIDDCFAGFQGETDAQVFLAKANAAAGADFGSWLGFLNRHLEPYGLSPLGLPPADQRNGENPFLNLIGRQRHDVAGPLVTICMCCFNAAPYVEHAVQSVLGQTYKNIELIIVDDGSTDGTADIISRLQREDKRIKLVLNPVNDGLFISRNRAFQQARGEFFTTMDADDFALPERLALQVGHLQQNPEHVGVSTRLVRMSEHGRFQFRKTEGGVYLHEGYQTLMIRTGIARETAGYWDSVRFAADAEYRSRLHKIFGASNVHLLKIPTVIALLHERSLTAHPVTGVNVGGIPGPSPVRMAYRAAWQKWHESNPDNLYIDFPQTRRAFDAPPELLEPPAASRPGPGR